MPAHIPIDSDSDSRAYWEGINADELRIQRCDVCSRAVFYPRSICPLCHSDRLSWFTASGKGSIYSYTVAHQAFGVFATDVPYVVAVIELEEGARMMSRIVDSPRERIAIGAPVSVTFATIEEGMTLPYFRVIG
jgi:uncharacterized OB-fold protein